MGKKHDRDATEPRFSGGPAWRQLQPLVEALPLAMLFVNPHGVPLFANQRFGTRFGQPPASSWLDLLEPSERAAAEVLWLTAGLERAPREAELSVHTSAGLKAVRCSIAPVEDKMGLLVWVIAFSETESDQTAEHQNRLARAAEAETELARMAGQQQELVALLSKSEAQRQEAEKRMEASEAQLAQMSGQLRDLEERVESATMRFQDAEADRQELHGLLEGSRDHSTQTEAQLAQALARARQLEESLLASDAQRQEVTTRLSDLERHLAISKARCADAEIQVVQTVDRCQELEALREDNLTQLAQATTRVRELEGLLEGSNMHSAEIEAQRHETAARLSELEERLGRSKAERLELENLLAERNVRIAERDVRIAEGEAQLAQATGQRHEVQALLERSEARLMEANAGRREVEGLLEMRQAELSQVSAKLSELEQLLARSEAHRRQAEESRVRSEAQLAQATAQQQKAEARLSELERHLEGAKARAAEAEAQRVQATAQRQTVQKLLERSNLELAQVKSRLHEVERLSQKHDALSIKADTERLETEERRSVEGSQTADMSVSAHSGLDALAMLEPSRHDKAEASQPGDSEQERTVRETAFPMLEGSKTKPALLTQSASRAEREPTEAPEGDQLDQVAARLRSRVLRDALARWRAERGAGPVPRLQDEEEYLLDATSYLVVEVDEAGTAVRVLRARPLEDSPLTRALAAPLGSDGQGWQRCAITGRPAYHYAKVVLGPHGSQSFERLLMPFSTVGGRVDRLVLLMVIDDGERV